MSHNATHTMDKEHGATASSLWTILAAVALPLIFNALLEQSQSALVNYVNAWGNWLAGLVDGEQVSRVVERVEVFDRNGYGCGGGADDEDRNEILITAVLAYASAHPVKGELTARVSLLPQDVTHSNDDSDSDADEPYSAAGELRKLRVTTRPAPDVDVTVAEASATRPRVRLRLTRASKTKKADEKAASAASGQTTVTTTLRLAACGAKAEEAIDEFVDRAFAFHAARLKRAEDAQGRYMFTPIPDSDASWKKYRLSDEKTFDSLFFAEKARVLSSLDAFEAKAGKYEIPGFPHKLGLLLWGPPGTGKTSLIKAIANKTRRHVVNIKLSQVGTNQKLADWLFDERYHVDGEATKVAVNECIFVFEDVDCVSDVVLSREAKGADAAPAGSDDRLSLAGLLNVLDGVVDSPGRIVIMTSNHPEKLDPALVRPGRINLALYLGFVTADSASAMVKHYFGGDDGSAVGGAVQALMKFDRRFSPAQLEHLCATHASAALLAQSLAAILDRARADADVHEVQAVLDDVVAAVVARADSKEEAPLVARVSSESLADLEKKAPCLRRSVSEAEAP